jgi:7-cyano-7-deazaguanine synthase
VSLGIDYGQRHRIELEYAANQCKRFGVARTVLRVEWTKPALTVPTERSLEEIRIGVSPAFLPGRNALFLTVAFAHAAGIGAHEVWIGVNAIDFSGYPDCRPEFIRAFQRMIDVAIPNAPRLVAPLIDMEKPAIAAEAAKLGLRRGATWSCYAPQFTEAGITPCQKCDACVLHDYAWKSYEGSARPSAQSS